MWRMFERNLLIWSTALGATMAIAGLLALRGSAISATAAARVAHTREVIEDLEATLSLLKDAESGQKGYQLTGGPRCLEPYEDSAGPIDRSPT